MKSRNLKTPKLQRRMRRSITDYVTQRYTSISIFAALIAENKAGKPLFEYRHLSCNNIKNDRWIL